MRPNGTLSKCVIASLALCTLANAARWVGDSRLRSYVHGITPARPPFTEATGIDSELAASIDAHRSIAANFAMIFMLATAATFLVWLWRAKANGRDAGVPGQECSPAMAVAVWFIPIISLYRPLQAVRETLEVSLEMTRPGRRTEVANANGILSIWWFTFIGGGICGLFGNFGAGSNPTLEEIATTALWSQTGLILRIVSAVLAAWIVHRITNLQLVAERAAAAPRPPALG